MNDTTGILTQNQIERVVDAIAETKRLLANEMAYSPRHRKQDAVARYEAHLAKLSGMLKANAEATYLA